MGRLAYRVRQFAGSLRGGLDDSQRAEIERLLTAEQKLLFAGMAPAYQRHSFVVYRKLLADGCDDLVVLQAGLLHDVGKGNVALPYRVAVVLLGGWWPHLLEILSAESVPGSWRHPFFVAARHAELGAVKLSEAGCGGRLVEIVRAHHGPVSVDHWCRRLQEIDAES
ncbi:MAG: hypothetical protein EPO21_20390 [Chloroflexota bacterium]|nr:MAG: hypothetical protein EPO21_20390 [Chloroflexota bacterium]